MSSLDITGKKKTGKGDQNLTYVDRLRNPNDRDIEFSAFSFSKEVSISLLSTTGFSSSGCTNKNKLIRSVSERYTR
jgi:hypothetical protein